jgi:hypothetical protein
MGKCPVLLRTDLSEKRIAAQGGKCIVRKDRP